MAEFAGITAGSRTVGQRSANISLAAGEVPKVIDEPTPMRDSDDEASGEAGALLTASALSYQGSGI